jgi:hypothetical protein
VSAISTSRFLHANDIKNKWNQQQDTIKNFTVENLSSMLERDFDDVIRISSNNSDSDDLTINDDWTYIGVSDPLPPSNHHHCRNIGHYRCRSPDYQRTKWNNNYLREQRKEMINKKRLSVIQSFTTL